ncbi:MAG TPA: LytTR family DNA-binding domain-containing protein [Pyrinomonadaceae bacterium]
MDRILVKANGHFVLLKTEEIDWIEAQGNYVRLHTSKKQYLVRRKIVELESKLNSKLFLRIHRSTIVNLDRIRELQPLSHGDLNVLLDDGTQLTWSRSFKDRLKAF